MAARSRVCRIGLSLACLAAGTAATVPAAMAASGTIGLALTSWRNALYETPDAKEECPDGVQASEQEQLAAGPEGIDLIRRRGGLLENRGPNGEMGSFNPLAVEDPLPFRELRTTVGFGVNLDGTDDGRATAKTRKHEKFTNPQGEKVDNELARVIGCVFGYRTGGFQSDYYTQEVADFSVNRHLIEITGVDDELNDPAVEVAIYKGYDRLVRTSDGKFVPYLSQRIDDRFPQYMLRTRGRIVDGTLITEPLPRALMPISSVRVLGERDMRDMTLRLKLVPDGAEGLLAGYENWRKYYTMNAKVLGGSELAKVSGPNFYRAIRRYADAYPDPKTGEFGYISAAYKVTAVRAMIVHPGDRNRARVASSGN